MSGPPATYWYGLAVVALVCAFLIVYIASNWREK